MPDLTRIATCCYCGNRSVLELRGDLRRQLACPACGARLSEMKPLKTEHPGKRTAPRPAPHPFPEETARQKPRPSRRKPKKRKTFARRAKSVFEEIFDVVEDIFD